MERKCSECGKTCGDNAHFNMKGEFAGWVLCGMCFNAYEKILLQEFKEASERGFEFYKSHKDYKVDEVKDLFEDKSRKRYEDLTGRRPTTLVIPSVKGRK
jgi:hypothetical protein